MLPPLAGTIGVTDHGNAVPLPLQQAPKLGNVLRHALPLLEGILGGAVAACRCLAYGLREGTAAAGCAIRPALHVLQAIRENRQGMLQDLGQRAHALHMLGCNVKSFV